MASLRHVLAAALSASCLGPRSHGCGPSSPTCERIGGAVVAAAAAEVAAGGGSGSCGPSPREIRKRKGNHWWGVQEGAPGGQKLLAL